MAMKRFSVCALGLLVVGLAAATAVGADPLRGLGRAEDEVVGGFDDAVAQPTLNAVFVASANGFSQVPAVLTPGTAFFRARVTDGGNALEYELRYNLAGPLQQAYLHIGQTGANGAPAVPLCLPDQPGLGGPIPVCPVGNFGILNGVVFAEDILPAAARQGVHDMQTLFLAMRARITYVDVWSGLYADHGEVRGQVGPLSLNEHGGPGTTEP